MKAEKQNQDSVMGALLTPLLNWVATEDAKKSREIEKSPLIAKGVGALTGLGAICLAALCLTLPYVWPIASLVVFSAGVVTTKKLHFDAVAELAALAAFPPLLIGAVVAKSMHDEVHGQMLAVRNEWRLREPDNYLSHEAEDRLKRPVGTDDLRYGPQGPKADLGGVSPVGQPPVRVVRAHTNKLGPK